MSLLFINPCSEKLSGSINLNGDKFCATCNKRIYNFSKMSDEELISFLSEPKENTCGIFDASQVIESTPMNVSHLKRRTTWKSILATLAATIISATAFAQAKKDSTKVISSNNFTITSSDTNQNKNSITISGIVTNADNGKTLDYISVVVKDSSNKIIGSAWTLDDGSFKILVPKSDSNNIAKLEVANIGYEKYTVSFTENHVTKDVFLNINLARKHTTRTSGMIIRAGMIASPSINTDNPNSHKISGEEIRRSPY